jgi:hypothetical protein
MKDFYYILGTDANCTLDEIKEAYRKLSKKFHPDLNQGDAYFENRFKEIQEAYETLSNPVKRLQYNQALKNFRALLHNEEEPPRPSYSEQTANQQYRSQTYKRKYTRRGPGVGATIALILLCFIVSVYAFQYFGDKKKTKVKQVADVIDAPVVIHKHHKKKHTIKVSVDSVRHENGLASIHLEPSKPPISKTTIEKPLLDRPSSVKLMTIATTTVYKNAEKNANGNYPYTVNIHTNATGVVNLRENDRFGASILQTIPANSKVFVLEKGNIYAKVSYNNIIGYVPKWAVAMQ